MGWQHNFFKFFCRELDQIKDSWFRSGSSAKIGQQNFKSEAVHAYSLSVSMDVPTLGMLLTCHELLVSDCFRVPRELWLLLRAQKEAENPQGRVLT